MMHIEFSAQETRAFDYERYPHPHPHVQRKMAALWLKSQKLPHKAICRFTGIAKHTLCTYLQSSKQGGLETLNPSPTATVVAALLGNFSKGQLR
jgi:hypothetical protein